MRIGISIDPYSNGYARFGGAKYLRIAQDGFSAIDYNMADTDIELYSMSDAEAEEKMLAEKAAAEYAGIEISQAHGPWRWPPQDFTVEDRQERMEKMKKSIFLTSMLGCKNWVVHPIMPYGTEDNNTDNAKKTWDLNLKFMSELLSFAKQQSVVICLENMPMSNFSMSKPLEVLKFAKVMNDPNFKICLDTGHVAIFPDISAGASVRLLGNEIRVLHIHDNMGDRDAHLWPTRGITDWPDFINALKEIKFDGVFSLETSPPRRLDDEFFGEECRKLCMISKELTKAIDL